MIDELDVLKAHGRDTEKAREAIRWIDRQTKLKASTSASVSQLRTTARIDSQTLMDPPQAQVRIQVARQVSPGFEGTVGCALWYMNLIGRACSVCIVSDGVGAGEGESGLREQADKAGVKIVDTMNLNKLFK